MRYLVFSGIITLTLFTTWLVSSMLSTTINDEELRPKVEIVVTDTTKIAQPQQITSPIPSKPKFKIKSNYINIDTLLWIAKKYVGTPYKMGGTSFQGMDCSGLIKTIFKEIGKELPHNSSELAKHGMLIPKIDQLVEGDLLFFHTNWENKALINHTGIYIGKGYFIHATSSLGTIISRINSPIYKNDFICATRILLPEPAANLASRTRMLIIK